MTQIFKDFDFSRFWDDSDYALKEYVNHAPSDQLIISIEDELGYKLPSSYIELMKMHNGGIPINSCFPTQEATSWAEDHIAINGIKGIGREKQYEICGAFGSQFMISDWGYPDIGVCICDCPSAGHDLVMLDYSECGKDGEPRVVHVDQEADYRITFLAQNFEMFIRGLVDPTIYDTSEEDLSADLKRIADGAFSTTLARLLSRQIDLDYGGILRKICRQLALTKGYFALHADDDSNLVYDIQFLLHSKTTVIRSQDDYLKAYPDLIAFGDGQFSTGGYAPGFVEDWLKTRFSENHITKNRSGGLEFSDAYARALKLRLQQYR